MKYGHLNHLLSLLSNSQKQTSLFWSSAKCGQDFSNLKAISSNFLYIWFNSQLPLMMSHKLGQHNFSEKCCFSSNEEHALNLHPCHHPLLSGILIGVPQYKMQPPPTQLFSCSILQQDLFFTNYRRCLRWTVTRPAPVELPSPFPVSISFLIFIHQ